MVEGGGLRDWSESDFDVAVFPYDSKFKPLEVETIPSLLHYMWPYRTSLSNGILFGRMSKIEGGLRWSEYGRLTAHKLMSKFSISFADVVTHNHFVLDCGGSIFNRHAPVIKLPIDAVEQQHLALLGILNSSTVCFWLKQVCPDRGNGGYGGGIASEDWERFYQLSCAKVADVPLPRVLPIGFGGELDALARRLNAAESSTVCAVGLPSRARLDDARSEHDKTWARMIALQEELDWQVYGLYGLLTSHEAAELQADPDSVPELKLGERAFEIVLARRMAATELDTQWFARHGSTPITELPAHWPEAYQRVVERRIEVIGKRRDIALIERPECKRRWSSEPWEKKERVALRSWLLDRCEDHSLWFAIDDTGTEQPRPMTVSRLADRLRDDGEFVSVARLYAGQDAELSAVVAEVIDAEHVPFLAAWRYRDTGLRKRRQWEQTWLLQREEDATGRRLNISVPPKYTSADFFRGSYWSHRGKLDVPKERFISYPQASPDGDGSLLLGWTGWNHRQQAHALMTIIEDRASRDGWARDRLLPLIAGLAEVLPWVRQWHGDIDQAFGMSPADAYVGYLEDQQRRHGVTASDLTGWRPQAAGRGRRAGSSIPASPVATPPSSTDERADPVDTQIRHTPTP